MQNWTVVADGLLFPEDPVACPDFSVLIVEIERRAISRVSPDGKVAVVAEVEGMAQRPRCGTGWRALRLQQRRLSIPEDRRH